VARRRAGSGGDRPHRRPPPRRPRRHRLAADVPRPPEDRRSRRNSISLCKLGSMAGLCSPPGAGRRSHSAPAWSCSRASRRERGHWSAMRQSGLARLGAWPRLDRARRRSSWEAAVLANASGVFECGWIAEVVVNVPLPVDRAPRTGGVEAPEAGGPRALRGRLQLHEKTSSCPSGTPAEHSTRRSRSPPRAGACVPPSMTSMPTAIRTSPPRDPPWRKWSSSQTMGARPPQRHSTTPQTPRSPISLLPEPRPTTAMGAGEPRAGGTPCTKVQDIVTDSTDRLRRTPCARRDAPAPRTPRGA
jgi:hypothetical protein